MRFLNDLIINKVVGSDIDYFIEKGIMNKEGKFIDDFKDLNIDLVKKAEVLKNEAQVEAQVEKKILLALKNKELSSKEIISIIGQKSRSGSFKKAINKLLENDLIEYSISDKPNSLNQKYRLTKKEIMNEENML